MRSPAIKSLRLIILFSVTPLLAQSDAVENYRVQSVRFVGNFNFSSSTLLQQMSSAPPSRLVRWFKKSTPLFYDAKLLQADIEQLTRFYRREGYLHAYLTLAEVNPHHRRRSVSLTVDVQEGLPVLVSAIRYRLNAGSAPENTQAVVEKGFDNLKLQAGTRFRDEWLRQDIDRLTLFLVDRGYPYAKISHRLEVMPAENRVVIVYEIDTGPPAVFGTVAVEGRRHAAERTMLGQLAFRPGDVFQKKALDKSQQRLYNLNLFEVVTVKALLPQPPQTEIPIQVAVREAPLFTTKLGVGYGREEQFRTFVSLQRLQFLGGVRRLNFQFKHTSLEPYYVDARLIQPAFFNPSVTFGVNPFVRRQTEPGFRLSRNGANLFLQQVIGTALNAGVTYTYEQVDLDLSSVAVKTLSENLRGLYNKSSLLIGLSANTTDNPFAPTAGNRYSVNIKYSGLGAGDYHYVKWMVDLRNYQKLGGFVAAMRLSLGRIASFDASGVVPVEDLFFSGGANSVRGWGRHELGPRDAGGKPTGGNSFVEASVEGRVPVWGSLQSALFCDAGNVWATAPRYSFTEIRLALGVGLRFQTPIGPIRFDLARPFFDRDRALRWHLTVGEAF